MHDCVYQRRKTVLVAEVDCVGGSVDKFLNQLYVAVHTRVMEGNPAVNVGCVDIHIARQPELEHFDPTTDGRLVQAISLIDLIFLLEIHKT